MPLAATDPWFMDMPQRGDEEGQRRYRRALTLSKMRAELETFETRPDWAARKPREIAYRKLCIARWQDYLAGNIEPPTGRKPQ